LLDCFCCCGGQRRTEFPSLAKNIRLEALPRHPWEGSDAETPAKWRNVGLCGRSPLTLRMAAMGSRVNVWWMAAGHFGVTVGYRRWIQPVVATQ